MPVTYTVTSADVASVILGSRLTEGVTFDWTNQKISVPSTVAQVTAQWAIDNCRFAESLFKGMSRPQIIVGAGKNQIGIDPDTLLPIETPAIAIFQGEWRIVTEKTSGVFVVKDVYMNLEASSTIPYDDVNGVFIQYLTSVTGAVATISTGEGGATPAQIWAYNNRSLTDKEGFSLSVAGVGAIASAVWTTLTSALTTVGSIGKLLSDRLSSQPASQSSVDAMASKVSEVHQMDGLDPAHPLSVSGTQRSSGTITQSISDNGTTTTVTRQ